MILAWASPFNRTARTIFWKGGPAAPNLLPDSFPISIFCDQEVQNIFFSSRFFINLAQGMCIQAWQKQLALVFVCRFRICYPIVPVSSR